MFEKYKTRAIRGAITVVNNNWEEIEEATVELLTQIIDVNCLNIDDISHVMFTMTQDLNAGFPAKAARLHLGWDDVPMVCMQEIEVPESLEKCIRVLVVINTKKDRSEINHVYLGEAKKLRPDLIDKD